ncbi:hypothetical protein EB796_023890 [Bugula neritina]|uniref:Uncharacterized protein n=1 Tax=Bugula neritina TaxID=10212 RepID=A0A7J7IV39_BUGNE|nr:hypothetical protein EB796_023890 [Bugula neritina]
MFCFGSRASLPGDRANPWTNTFHVQQQHPRREDDSGGFINSSRGNYNTKRDSITSETVALFHQSQTTLVTEILQLPHLLQSQPTVYLDLTQLMTPWTLTTLLDRTPLVLILYPPTV